MLPRGMQHFIYDVRGTRPVEKYTGIEHNAQQEDWHKFNHAKRTRTGYEKTERHVPAIPLDYSYCYYIPGIQVYLLTGNPQDITPNVRRISDRILS